MSTSGALYIFYHPMQLRNTPMRQEWFTEVIRYKLLASISMPRSPASLSNHLFGEDVGINYAPFTLRCGHALRPCLLFSKAIATCFHQPSALLACKILQSLMPPPLQPCQSIPTWHSSSTTAYCFKLCLFLSSTHFIPRQRQSAFCMPPREWCVELKKSVILTKEPVRVSEWHCMLRQCQQPESGWSSRNSSTYRLSDDYQTLALSNTVKPEKQMGFKQTM